MIGLDSTSGRCTDALFTPCVTPCRAEGGIPIRQQPIGSPGSAIDSGGVCRNMYILGPLARAVTTQGSHMVMQNAKCTIEAGGYPQLKSMGWTHHIADGQGYQGHLSIVGYPSGNEGQGGDSLVCSQPPCLVQCNLKTQL